jgi:hypothetical protein
MMLLPYDNALYFLHDFVPTDYFTLNEIKSISIVVLGPIHSRWTRFESWAGVGYPDLRFILFPSIRAKKYCDFFLLVGF